MKTILSYNRKDLVKKLKMQRQFNIEVYTEEKT